MINLKFGRLIKFSHLYPSGVTQGLMKSSELMFFFPLSVNMYLFPAKEKLRAKPSDGKKLCYSNKKRPISTRFIYIWHLLVLVCLHASRFARKINSSTWFCQNCLVGDQFDLLQHSHVGGFTHIRVIGKGRGLRSSGAVVLWHAGESCTAGR